MSGDAALLDLDGTLTDSRPGIIGSLLATLRELGHHPDPDEDLRWMIGPPIEQTIETVLARWGDPRTAWAVAAYRRHYAAGGMYDNSVYPGIAAALEALAADRWTLFVATAKRTRTATAILEHFGLSRFFHAIHGSEDGPRLDSKSELLAHVLTTHGLSPARTVMIGDRKHDILGARANRMHSVGAAWGYGGRRELLDAGADAIAVMPAELADLARMQVDPADAAVGQRHGP